MICPRCRTQHIREYAHDGEHVLDCSACGLFVTGRSLERVWDVARHKHCWTAEVPCSSCGARGIVYSGREDAIICIGCRAERPVIPEWRRQRHRAPRQPVKICPACCQRIKNG